MTLPIPKTYRYEFPSGSSKRQIIKLLAKAIYSAHLNPRIIRRARLLVQRCDPASIGCEIEALWDLVTSNIRYVKDPLGAEHITDPVRLDLEIERGEASEDCESIAAYAASLASSLGIRSVLEAQERPEGAHLALVLYDRHAKHWVPFDPVGFAEFGYGLSVRVPGATSTRFYDSLSGVELGKKQMDSELLDEMLGYDDSPSDATEAVFGEIGDSPWQSLASSLVGAGESIYGLAKKKPTSTLTQETKPKVKEESFLSKYGLPIGLGIGAVVLLKMMKKKR